jgi:hypothetical protein
MVIRVRGRWNGFQLIPRDVFSSNDGMDLPGPLIDSRFHWMDLDTGMIYVTEPRRPWDITSAQWVLDWKKRQCIRKANADNTTVTVIDPHSNLFKNLTSVFEDFELKRHMLVYQMPGDNTAKASSELHHTKGLVISLERLNLRFFVNRENRLYSPQLRCEIDRNQDAGTWYGLQSKIICRARDDKISRSILVPLGNILTQTTGNDVKTWIEPSGNYGTFRINTVLSRIDCVAEPLLLYTKALLHAYTSRVRPDPLTQRTATEVGCRNKTNDPWGLAFLLCPIAFDLHANMPLIKTLAAFGMYDELRQLPLPAPVQFKDFRPNEVPQLELLCKLVDPFRLPFVETEEHALMAFASNKTKKKLESARLIHETKSAQDANAFAQHMLKQWPTASPSVDGLGNGLLVNVTEAHAAIIPEWRRLHDNLQLSNFLDATQKILTSRASPDDYEPPAPVTARGHFPRPLRGTMVVPKLRDDLLSRNIDNLSPDDLRIMGAAQGRAQPPKKPTENSAQSDIAQERQQPVGQLHPGPSRNTLINKTAVTNELSTIISDFSETKSLVRQRYAEDLSQSLSAFKKLPPPRDFGRGTHDWKRSYRTLGHICFGKRASCYRSCVRSRRMTLSGQHGAPSGSRTGSSGRLLPR